MAPSRKRAANKAAAAAAARRKWNIGDLVLAKVKGHPAWPAKVSDPEDYKHAVDAKKVFVVFFGTGQIANCHPVDVEEFTEDKKATILGKRHGKGADFVRAANEIIVCFDNMKKQDQGSSLDGTEGSITTENNSKEPLTKLEKDVAPVVAVKSLAAVAANDLESLTEAAVAAAAEDDLHREGMQIEAACSNFRFTEPPVSSTYSSRRRTDAAQSQNGSRRRISSRQLRSSSGIDASRPQNLSLPSVNSTRSSRRLGSNSLRDRSLRRSKRFVKSDSEENDADSPASASNYSMEDNDSGTMTADSDVRSYNDGSSVESGSKPMETESLCDNNNGETELSDRLDFQNRTVIIKKKRKHHRKRHHSDAGVATKPDVVVSEVEVLKPEYVSPTNNEKSINRISKDDGDEHLPLVKRARIRMGRPSPVEEQECSSVHEGENIQMVVESSGTQLSVSLNEKEDTPVDRVSVPVQGNLPNLSFSHQSPKKPQFWESRKNFVDGEAALPPSKRLHRALEAMSANVAENSQRDSSCSPAVVKAGTEVGSGLVEDHRSCESGPSEHHRSGESGPAEDHRSGESGPAEDHRSGESGPAEDHRSGESPSTPSDLGVGSNNEVSGSGKTSCSNDGAGSELKKDSLDHMDGAGSIYVKKSPLDEYPAEVVTANQHANAGSANSCGELSLSDCNVPELVLSLTANCKIEAPEQNEAAELPDPDISEMRTGVTLVEEIAGGSFDIGTSVGGHAVDEGHESQKTKCLEESKPSSTDRRVKHSPTPVKSLGSSHRRSSVNLQSAPGAPCSIAKVSPPRSSIPVISTADSKNYIVNNGSSSSSVQLHLEKAKLAGKSSSKVESLSTFETAIRSLTRTKESIGRATHIAIDCAKSGFATKVVEILARSLEKESSSHKKVDLFFLVDSITQFSRGIKGDGAVYPSAIQALLPRLLLAAAPPGSSSHENHRQCLKVLRVWQQRKLMPEPLIRHHIQELDALCGTYPTVGSRRSLRNERPFDDPIREMEGMLVDEYGSNSSFQLPGFCMPPMRRDDDGGTDSDEESFEAVTPEHNAENLDKERTPVPAAEKRSHILEDVDGELEMEDVAPCCEAEMTSTSNTSGTVRMQLPHQQSDKHNGAIFAPASSKDNQLAPTPLPRSLPPPPPPPPHPIPSSGFPPAECDPMANGRESKHYPSSQNFNSNVRESMVKNPGFSRTKHTSVNSAHHRTHEYRDFEAQVPRHMPDSSSTCFSDRPASHFSGRANGVPQSESAFSKGFHLRPPHPAPSNQFSYVQEHRSQSQRDMPPPPHPNRFHARNAENGNFYRDRDRNKFAPRDHIGECWRPPLPSISGPCYQDGGRMAHTSASYGGPPREPPLPNNRWSYRPRSLNHRHFNPYRPPSEGPIPVANRGPLWRPR